jgi:pimeloyl-ACP methyl ester carboxylesterase
MDLTTERDIRIETPDGLALGATVTSAPDSSSVAVLLPGGGGVDRTEHGFYQRLAGLLADVGVSSLRCEHRAYLAVVKPDECPPVTLSGLMCDVLGVTNAAAEHGDAVHVLGASLTAGVALAATASNRSNAAVKSLALLYPVLDYWQQLIEINGFGDAEQLDPRSREVMASRGGLVHRSYLQIGPSLLSELFTWDVNLHLGKLTTPTLVLHGPDDPVIPYATTARVFRDCRLATVDELLDSTHGFGRNPLGTIEGDRLAAEIASKYITWLLGRPQ